MEGAGVGEGQRERERTLSLPLPLAAVSTKSFNLEWVPLANHPVFFNHHHNCTKNNTATSSKPQPARFGISRGNLAAWDSVSSRLYLWDTDGKRLHRLSVRFGDPNDSDGTPSIEAAYPSEVMLLILFSFGLRGEIGKNFSSFSLLLYDITVFFLECLMNFIKKCRSI